MDEQVPAFREPSPLERTFNRVFGALVGLGLGPRDYYVLQVRGRRSGRLFSTPVNVIEAQGARFLVAPRGRTQWVRNAEAAGEIALRQGRRVRRFRVRAVADGGKPPVLRAYLDRFKATVQRYFPLPAGSSVDAFASLVQRYPVFELLPGDHESWEEIRARLAPTEEVFHAALAFAVLLSLTLATGCQPSSRGSLTRAGQPGEPLTSPKDDAAFQGNWPAYGNDAGGTRYSPLTQIDRANVGHLRLAWIYRTGEADDTSRARRKAAFEATPIVVDGTLFVSTPFNRVIALDPETGQERWVYDPQVDRSRNFSEVTSRGVSTWLDPTRVAGQACRRRIFAATIDARLLALDALTGAPCADFGRNGQVDLTHGIRIGMWGRGNYQVTSPPAVIGSLIVVGSSIGDNVRAEMPRGVVRAYDARTGALRWSWDPIPHDAADPARATWGGDSWRRTGAANAWAPLSADPERGLLFVPTSSPSPDFYGGERLGANRYANSVVALHSESGELAWHFQVVHHDLWDYDIPAQPTLVTLTREGEAIPAVAVATKMGHLFVLDRRSGTPLFPVEERPVPRSTVPGEETSPTQPFPLRPGPLVPQRLTPSDAWGPTPVDRDWCRERIARLRSEGIFTPPSLEGTVVFPGFMGGMHWGSLSHDPVRHLLIVNTNRFAHVVRLMPRMKWWLAALTGSLRGTTGEFASQFGTPYGMYREGLRSPSGAPCNAPPWGALTAVDLASGEVRWEMPLGISDPRGSGSTNLGGAVTTAGGLVFIAAARDARLRAFDIDSGRELWSAELPASAQATPMTYQLGPGRRQFVAIAAGGHGKARTKMGDHVVAFTLP